MSLIKASAHALPLLSESIQCCVTSPPYWGLRDYGVPPLVWGGEAACAHEWGDVGRSHHPGQVEQTKWENAEAAGKGQNAGSGQWCYCGAWYGHLGLEPTPDLYVAHLVLVFEEVRRVLKPDGVLWMNLGDSYAGGGYSNHDINGPTWKAVMNGDKRRSRQQDQRNVLAPLGIKPKDLIGIPWMAAFALRTAGWYLRSDVIWSKPNPMPESVTDRPTKAHEYLFLLTKSERYYYNADAIAEQASEAMLAQVQQGYRGLGLKDYETAGVQNPSSVKARIIAGARRHGLAQHKQSELGQNEGGDLGTNKPFLTRNKRSVWTVNTQPYPDAHFATFPEALIEPCILAGSRVGDSVLDPFIGTGTVGQVAERLMRRWVGTDLGYQLLAKRRTAQRGLRLDEFGAESA